VAQQADRLAHGEHGLGQRLREEGRGHGLGVQAELAAPGALAEVLLELARGGGLRLAGRLAAGRGRGLGLGLGLGLSARSVSSCTSTSAAATASGDDTYLRTRRVRATGAARGAIDDVARYDDGER
jgi:hypothetical protein